MEILEPPENAAHVSVRVVNRFYGLLDSFEGIFRKFNDLRGMAFL